MRKILSLIRKAVEDYNMIEEGDKIAIGLSGGKDSLTLLIAMNTLKLFYPKKFEIMALTIDPGSNSIDTTELEKLCKSLNIEYVIEKTNIKEVVFDIRKEKNPCSLCANLRRGALNGVAEAHGCNKVALAHHQDDVMETFFMSLFYNGNIHTFSPTTYLSRINIVTIRPMIYVAEKDIKGYAKRSNLPVVPKFCPMDGHSKREYIKDLLKNLNHDIPRLRACIFGAITRSNIPGWEHPEE
jgi:tRNA(Ile)-lysidine synthetase-like protein